MIIDLLDSRPALKGGGHDVVLGRIGKFDPEGFRQRFDGHAVNDGRVAVLHDEAVECLLLGLKEHLLHQRAQGFKIGLNLVLLGVRNLAPSAGSRLGIVIAQKDRHLDLVKPEVLHSVDLGAHQKCHTEEGKGHTDGDDHGNRHRQIAAQAVANLTKNETSPHPYLEYP